MNTDFPETHINNSLIRVHPCSFVVNFFEL
jgi:hypothetical protein